MEPLRANSVKTVVLVHGQRPEKSTGSPKAVLADLGLSRDTPAYLFLAPHSGLETTIGTWLPGTNWTAIPLRFYFDFFYPGHSLDEIQIPPGVSRGLYLFRWLLANLQRHGNPLQKGLIRFLDTLTDIPEFWVLLYLFSHWEAVPFADPGPIHRPHFSPGTPRLTETTGKDWLPPDSVLTHPHLVSDEHILLPTSEAVESFLKSDFLKASLPQYTVRSQQIDFAKAVLRTVRNGTHTYVEAPTGTGKTLAYLTAAAHILEKNPWMKIAIATATLNLQSQITHQDWAVLKKRFPDLRIALLKGKRNFICFSALARLYSTLFQSTHSSVEERVAWLYFALVCWLNSGDMESIPPRLVSRFPILTEMQEDIRSDLHCVETLCVRKSCSYSRHYTHALKAGLIVVNHFLLPFLPVEIKNHLLLLVIDEADRSPNNFRKAFSREFSARDLYRILYHLEGSEKRRGLIELLKSELPQLQPHLKAIQETVSALREALDQVTNLLRNANEPANSLRIQTLAPWKGGGFQKDMATLSSLVSRLQDQFESLRDDLQKPRNARWVDSCQNYIVRLQDLVDGITTIGTGVGSREFVHSFTRGKEDWNWTLTRMPVPIAPTLKQVLYQDIDAVVFTSATLTVNRCFDFIRGQLEPEEETGNLREYILPPVFNWSQVCRCYIDPEVPPYDYRIPKVLELYRLGVARAVIDYALALQGRTLVLFMSYADLKFVHRKVRPLLESQGIRVLQQNGSSWHEIREFRQEPRSVLMGVDRFWSGVDFPGETLQLVIIAKAPNPSLSDPYIAHCKEWDDRFMADTYPVLGALRMAQGFGRLIRSPRDRGGVVILDNRYRRGWNRLHLENLPVPAVVGTDRKAIISGLKQILQGRRSA